jgi:diguanylate cyclase (GGDEF)-like protein/PAS domain S-box-containing protein
MQSLIGSYDLSFVALSIVLAVCASYAAFDLAGHIASEQGLPRIGWLAFGAAAMGVGICATHYVGVLAPNMPIVVFYHLPTVAASLLAAVMSSGVAFYVISQPKTGLGQVSAGSAVMGIGIAAMHYIGMAAMRCAAVITYQGRLVALSIILAIAASFVALELAFPLRNENWKRRRKALSALIMGGAIALVHYTGMWAASFHPIGGQRDLRDTVSISTLGALVIGGSCILAILGAVAVSMFDCYLARKKGDLSVARQSELYFRTMAEAVPVIIWTATPQGDDDFINQRCFDYTGMKFEQLRGMGWKDIVHPDDVATTVDRWKNALEVGEAYEHEYRMRGKDGVYRWFLVRANPIHGADGRIIKWFGTTTDIEDQKHSQQVLEEQVRERTEQLAEAKTRLSEEQYFRTMTDALPEIIWTADPQGSVDYINPRVDYIGRTADQIRGSGWTSVIHSDDLPAVAEKWQRSIRTGDTFEIEYRLQGKDGSFRWFLVRANPIRNEAGQITRWIGICTDIEGQKHNQEVLEQQVLRRTTQLADANTRLKEEQYFRTMANALPDVIWTADAAGTLDYVNRTFEFSGRSFDQIMGMGWVNAIHADDLPSVMAKWETSLRTKEAYEMEYRLKGKEGVYRWFLVRANPIRNAKGELLKWIGTCTDIETQKQSQKILEQHLVERTTQLADANERLHKESYFRLMADAVPQLIWTSDAQGNVDYCNRYTLDYAGLTIDELGGMDWLEAAVHPDDKEARREKLENALRTGEAYDLEYRLRGKDGEYRWFLLRVRPIRDDAGGIEKWIGTCTDIENQKQNQKILEEQILERTMQLEDANTRLHEEMIERDFARNQLDVQNEKMMSELQKRSERATMLAKMGELLQSCISRDEVFTAALGYAPKIFPALRGALALLNEARNLAEVIGSWAECVIPASEFEPSQCWGLRTGQPHFVVAGDTTARCAHAQGVNGTYLCVPIIAQGETLGILHLQETGSRQMDTSELSFKTTFAGQVGLSIANIRLREALRTQSVRDALTGLFNRRYLEEILERELRRAGRAKQSVGILMLDLDYFKRFNDTYGHEAGDTVLRETAGLLLKNVRAEDFVCRFGGEEFVVILPTADQEGSRTRGDRLREKVRDLTVMHQGKSLGMVTFSIGVAVFPEHGTTPKELMAAADAALYEAKRAGRDRVVVATKTSAGMVVPEVARSVAGCS